MPVDLLFFSLGAGVYAADTDAPLTSSPHAAESNNPDLHLNHLLRASLTIVLSSSTRYSPPQTSTQAISSRVWARSFQQRLRRRQSVILQRAHQGNKTRARAKSGR